MRCIINWLIAAIVVGIAGCGSESSLALIPDESATPVIAGPWDQSTHVPPGDSPGYGSGSIVVVVARPAGGETFGYKEQVT
ncbi:MAG TPA: hypothetical protein VMX58_06245 [Patescibacteria group bacterium]|nr:hypothetical protein [Patescibacteria group bacterium]